MAYLCCTGIRRPQISVRRDIGRNLACNLQAYIEGLGGPLRIEADFGETTAQLTHQCSLNCAETPEAA
jgi:hypothetical protein